MRRSTFVVLAVASALCSLFATGTAHAQAPTVIDAVDSPGPQFQPPNVTVTTGETVRWEFDQATAPHTVTSTGGNWSIDETRDPGGAAIERTFDQAGVYSFLCRFHSGMTGSVTVEDEGSADQLENVLVFSKTAGFRHTSIPNGIAAIEQLGADHGFNVDATEDAAQFTDANLAGYDAVVWLSTTGDVLDETQQRAFERYVQSGGGYVGIHAAADTEYDWAWYGELLGGAYFQSHPAIQQADVVVEDADEPSTAHLPARWTRTDEWYNYRANPREAGVNVLATLDEGTYSPGAGAMGDDHPTAWCTEFDGGRAWYTGGGHTEASYTEPAFVEHLLGGIRTAARDVPADCGDPRQSTPREFEKVTLDDDTENPMELDIAPDGRVFYIERTGEVNIWKPDTRSTVVAGTIPVYLGEENGLIGLALAPDFETSGWVYLTYSMLPEETNTQVVARYKVVGDQLDMDSRQDVFTWTHQRETCCHSSGSLYFGPDGNLYISTGDNTNPFESSGFAPIDERPGREPFDAQRTSANTNDLNGKILRITPNATAPGYTVPAGNLFAPGTANTRPEIFAMGFRNPFRFTVDQQTGWVLMADYGPDAPNTVAGRGPQGSVEFNAVTSPGNYGWPYCVRTNVAYNDYDFATNQSGPLFNCGNPVNESPNNTGQTNLPPARPATMWMGYTETDNRFPELGTGGAPMGGPRYHFDPDNPSDTKFPEAYDGEWFIAEWNSPNDWIKTATLDAQGNATDVDPFPDLGYVRPMDLDFGPDGSLYVIEWGSGFGGNNGDSGVYRIDYVAGERAPLARATATPDNGDVPLEVMFSSEGSVDPEGTPLTYAWDFDGDGDTDSAEPNPTHTYGEAGAYNARLTVTDASGKSAVDNVQVVVGNNRPQVTIEIPEEGSFVDYGDTVPYRIAVEDREDTTVDCDGVVLQSYLGHNTHAHPLRQYTGCEGSFETLGVSGHGPNENIFPLIEATYTDSGLAGGGGRLTGLDQHILQPKRKQAEFFTSDGRTADARGGGDPGVQTEQTTDAGGGSNIGFIEDGDYVSFAPMNFKNINALVFRVASGGAGGTIEVRLDRPDGELVATSPTIPNTGGWQSWRDVSVPVDDPGGTHEVFVVFRHPSDTGGLMNLNWVEAEGRGAASNARPKVSVAAEPDNGRAPLTVQFDGTARDTDAEPGEELTYAWDFGVDGTDEDTSTEEDPSFTYAEPGVYTATLTVTDALGATASDSVEVRVSPSGQCPQDNVRSDEFDGTALDTSRWTVTRPDGTRPPTVSGGQLHFPIDNGSIYGPGTSARNIVVQPLPQGAVEVTAKITVDALTQNYQQAGLRVYADDDNWASVHMIHAGGQRDFEFIYESNGNPRNEGADKLGGISADAPLTYWVRLVSDGSQLTASYSYDGETFSPVGRPASLATFSNPRIGPVALSDQAPDHPVAHFDWIRFDPDAAPGGGALFADEFDGSDLGAGWSVVRRTQELQVSGGALRIPAAPGDIYGGRNDASNLVVRDAPGGAWEAVAKVDFQGSTQYHQAGIMVYGDDQNFTKFGRIAHTTGGDEKFEFIYENAGTPRNEGADSSPTLPADFPAGFWVRISSDGSQITGAYSTDGNAWTPVGRPAPLPANPKLGLFAFSNDGGGNPVAAFDSFAVTAPGGGGPSGPSRDDQFDGTSLDKDRWNAIVRENPSAYQVAGGRLTITTEPGDIYTGDSSPPPNNFILQDASHAGEDWVIETKLSGTIDGGYGQGGLLAYSDGDNYVKLDPISDAGSPRINRIELRSEVDGTPVGPAGQPDPEVPQGTSDIWVRLTKSGTTYSGEYSFDGETWTAMGSVTNAMASPDFGVYAFGPQADGVGDTVSFDSFTLDGADAEPCDCVGQGDEFEGTSLDTSRWQVVREDASRYEVWGGALRVTTVGGDIYAGGDPASTRNFFLQEPANDDWVIETKVSGTLSGGYEQAGLLVYQDDGDYIKYDLISDDGQTVKNRIELRSEENDAVQDPQPQVSDLDVDAAWLRLTKTGDMYQGHYSLDGVTWQSIGLPVQNDMAAPRFGLFTLGVNSPGGTAVFDHFSVDGETGCPPPEPTNRAPQIASADASPSTGFAPLDVAFTVDASDPDGDELSYRWDFDGDGTVDSTAQNPSHTYTAPGEHTARVTVSDGELEVFRTIPVQALEPDHPDARFRVLVFSKTTGFRHDSIDEGHAAIEALGREHEFQVDHTEDATAFRDSVLGRYDAVVFLSTTGDPLNDTQQRAFRRFIEAGNGFTGIHAAADTEYGWTWYGHLVGGYFHSHPPGTPTAMVDIEDRTDHSTQGIPARWERTDEWYNYKSPDFQDPEVGGGDYSPRNGGVHVLATVDETTYDEQDGNATDDDHPISWCQRYGGGRSWYTGMGHTAASFSEPHYLNHILGGIEISAGAAGSDECGVPEPGNAAPTVEAAGDPRTGRAPLEVAFSATGRDADGDALTYSWDFGDGGTSLRQNPDHTYLEPGTYMATVTVRDPDGATGTAGVEIIVTDPPGNTAPTVEAAGDPTYGKKPPLTVQFSAAGTDPDGDALTYAWDFGDGGRSFLQNPSHTYTSRGTFTATVTVTDARGATDTATVEITVGNRAPAVKLTASPVAGPAPLRVSMSAAGSDPDGDKLSYRWDFGDGKRDSGSSTSHRYKRAGVYAVTVTATDKENAVATDEVQITVTAD